MESVSRRHVLAFPAAAFGFLPSLAPILSAQSRQGSRLDWRGFLNGLHTIASLGMKGDDEEGFVAQVADLLRTTDHQALLRIGDYTRSPHGRPGYPGFRNLERSLRVEVDLLSFDPGDRIPAHDHPGMSAIMMCASGQVSVQNYEFVGARPAGCLLRRVSDSRLEYPGEGTLTSHRANIHQLRSDAGCEVIDVFSPPYDEHRVAATRWYRVSNNPLQALSSLYAAEVAQ